MICFFIQIGYFDSVRDIKIEYLRENNIKGIILDVDNTLIDYYRVFPKGTKEWVQNLKKEGIKFCILSNSNKLDKVSKVASEINVPYFYFGKKPLKIGFNKARRKLELNSSNIAAVGDQIMTDIIGANRCKIFSILVKPIKEKDIFITKIKRPIENFIIKSYLKKVEKNKEGN
ncbi:MAG TPA: YqeG family HAD IIIA-type phosphatase [Clostridiales bacterium]|nr:YqeG family HAD IIIA-type phosphatase [Clostridiales bacterium]